MTNSWNLREAFAQARNGRKIEAIKQMRADTGLGLKEAKDIVEAFLDQCEAAVATATRTHAAPVVDKCDDGMVYCVMSKQFEDSHWLKHSWDTQYNWALTDARSCLDNGASDVMVVKVVARTKRTLVEE